MGIARVRRHREFTAPSVATLVLLPLVLPVVAVALLVAFLRGLALETWDRVRGHQ